MQLSSNLQTGSSPERRTDDSPAQPAMLDGVDKPDAKFNLAFMICIPKDHDTILDDGTPAYMPSSTRPLSVVDAGNRILACMIKAALERAIGARIFQCQRGFLEGRVSLEAFMRSSVG